MKYNGIMTFGETFRAIRGGDFRVLAAFMIECAIMLSPVALLWLIFDWKISVLWLGYLMCAAVGVAGVWTVWQVSRA